MRFFEYESRRIAELSGIPVTEYGFCTNAPEARAAAERIGGSVVIKSQVLTGGRMKAGGVKFADSPEEAERHAAAILELEINGHMPRGVLVDPKLEVEQEYYAGVVWDGTAKRPLMLFSDMGGIDIEEVAERHPTTSAAATSPPCCRCPIFRPSRRLQRRASAARHSTGPPPSWPGLRGCSATAI
jgi:succinyl-CoA synthetase beta subunit